MGVDCAAQAGCIGKSGPDSAAVAETPVPPFTNSVRICRNRDAARRRSSYPKLILSGMVPEDFSGRERPCAGGAVAIPRGRLKQDDDRRSHGDNRSAGQRAASVDRTRSLAAQEPTTPRVDRHVGLSHANARSRSGRCIPTGTSRGCAISGSASGPAVQTSQGPHVDRVGSAVRIGPGRL